MQINVDTAICAGSLEALQPQELRVVNCSGGGGDHAWQYWYFSNLKKFKNFNS